MNSGALSTVHFAEQWRQRADEEEGRREGQGETDQAVPLSDVAGGGGVTVANQWFFFISLCFMYFFFSLLMISRFSVSSSIFKDDGVVVNGGSRWRCCFQRQRERPKEREVVVLLFSSISCFYVLFLCSNLPFFVLLHFQLLWFLNRHPSLFFPTWKCPSVPSVFFLNLPPIFRLFFYFYFSFFLFFSSSSPLYSSLSPVIYKKEKRERELLPLSNHGTGVRWPDGHWAAASGLLAGLVPSVFSSNGRWRAWVLLGFVQVGRKRESGKKYRGAKPLLPLPLRV